MIDNETLMKIVHSEEVHALKPSAKLLFLRMVSLYTGFHALQNESDRIPRAEELRMKLLEKYGITNEHPAVLKTLEIIFPQISEDIN